MPPFFETFRNSESHAATVAYELTHWMRHPSRLNRDFGRKRWGDEGYAFEELIAELDSAFLCADLLITPEIREDHASYIHNWLQVLKDDKRGGSPRSRMPATALMPCTACSLSQRLELPSCNYRPSVRVHTGASSPFMPPYWLRQLANERRQGRSRGIACPRNQRRDLLTCTKRHSRTLSYGIHFT